MIGLRNKDIFFFFGIYQYIQWMMCTIGIPNPVIGIKRPAQIVVHGSIEGTVIASVFRNAYRPFVATI